MLGFGSYVHIFLLVKQLLVIYTDSHSALAIAWNLCFMLEVHYHYVRERWSEGDIKLAYVPTEDNLGVLFTKALPQPKFEAFWQALNLVPFVTSTYFAH